MSVFTEFREREMVYDATDGAEAVLESEQVTAYIGFDPSADSLHVGSLLPVMGLVHLQRHGHKPIAIVGGGTGAIGDPSGKSQERGLLSREQIEHNLAGIQAQLQRFLDFTGPSAARVINNADWLATISLIDFLRDVGKYFTVNYMVAKESVKRRMESEDGISFTEFSYMLLQAYDYLVLHQKYGCTLQLGGSDQWGNITAGTELIRRVVGERGRAHALVFPLVATATGTKFGKTEAGTIWLDPKRTSPFRFYQFWLNTDDRDVIRYLRFFTLLPLAEIGDIETHHAVDPSPRIAQLRLADEVTRMVHGEDELQRAQRASRVLFGEAFENLSSSDLLEIFADVPSTHLDRTRLEGDGIPVADLLVEVQMAPSKGEARRLLQGGGVYLNNLRIGQERPTISLRDAVGGDVLVLRKGKKTFHVIRLSEER